MSELERKRQALEAQLRLPNVQTVRRKLQQKISSGSQSDVQSGAAAEKVMLKLQSAIGKKQRKRDAVAKNHAYRLAGRCSLPARWYSTSALINLLP